MSLGRNFTINLHDKGSGKVRAKFVHVSLVVHDLALLFASLHRFELAADAGVSDRHLEWLHQAVSCIAHDVQPDHHHDSVEHSQVTHDFQITLLIDLGEFTQHLVFRDAHIVEL